MTAPGEPANAGRAGDELLDAVVIGASQAGLAIAWHLARHHLRFVVPARELQERKTIREQIQAFISHIDTSPS